MYFWEVNLWTLGGVSKTPEGEEDHEPVEQDRISSVSCTSGR